MRNQRPLENQPLGLDEIIIVNPSSTPVRLKPIADLKTTRPSGGRPSLFLGEDGVVYALHGREEPIRAGDLLLGADGAFYPVQESDLSDDPSDLA